MANTISDFGFLRVAAVSPELKVADTAFNTDKIIEAVKEANKSECRLILFPELSVTGFTCADLFFQGALRNSALESIQKLTALTAETESTIIVGAPLASNGRLFNCAFILSEGAVKGIVPKVNMANSDEFYEERWFTGDKDRNSETVIINGSEYPFGADLLFRINGLPDCMFGVEICEDLWTVKPPSFDMASAGANILLNLSAGSELLGKANYRRQLVSSQSARCLAAYIYSGAGPGESSTDMVFSGHSIIAENGIILSETERFSFETGIIYADIDIERLNNERIRNNSFASSLPDKIFRIIDINLLGASIDKLQRHISQTPFIPSDAAKLAEHCKELYAIQTIGLAKRLKHLNQPGALIGISGGLDSTLALLVVVGAFKKLGMDMKGIHAVSMPGFGTSARTKSNAIKLAELIGASVSVIPISKSVELHFKDIGHDPNIQDIVYENAQARERTQVLLDVANKTGAIVVGTSDLSELALGWCTYNGDHISNYSVNSGIPKTLVRKIVEWYSESVCRDLSGGDIISGILKDICETPISPELIPGKGAEDYQETEKSIGPYILHDFFLYYMHRHNFPPKKILFLARIAFDGKFGEDEILKNMKIFYKRFFSQQFKRSCMPDGIRTGYIDLSPRGDLRMPSDAVADVWLKELENL